MHQVSPETNSYSFLSASWVIKETVPVAQQSIDRAARLLRDALAADPKTLELVGGERWWTLRGRALSGEWIEVRASSVGLRGGEVPASVN